MIKVLWKGGKSYSGQGIQGFRDLIIEDFKINVLKFTKGRKYKRRFRFHSVKVKRVTGK